MSWLCWCHWWNTHLCKSFKCRNPQVLWRKENPTQYVLAACTFDLKFMHVLPGLECTTSGPIIMKNALIRSCLLKILEGTSWYNIKLYKTPYIYIQCNDKVDFISRKILSCRYWIHVEKLANTPYRGKRYHLKEYSRNPPRYPWELFNLRHALLWNAVERAFGVLQKCFPIIGSSTEPHYCLKALKEIIFACCISHNYLLCVDPNDVILAQVDNKLGDEAQEEHHGSGETMKKPFKGKLLEMP